MNGVKFLLDTNFVIGLLKQREEVIKVVSERSLAVDECAYNFITRIELLGFPEITQHEIEGIESLLFRMQYLALTTEIENLAIALRRQHRLKLPDTIIAATAKCFKLELLTFDQQLANRMHNIKKE